MFLKEDTLPMCKREQKMVEELKDIKINELKNCLEQWKEVLIGVLHHVENTLKVTEVQTHKNKCTIFKK